MKKIIIAFLFIGCFLINLTANAAEVYQSSTDFIKQVFNNTPPKPNFLWLKPALKAKVETILQHKYAGLRVRYWQQNSNHSAMSVWILNEIGKEKPITTGIVIRNNKIEQVKILAFRESRGWEVRYPFFTQQFNQAKIVDTHLNKNIDNITGATLSVRAIKKLAIIALLLNQNI